jgi:Mg2+ and Co2+ transporter CorA
MGFLALVALATALGPLVFDVGPEAERALTVVEWVLVAAFAAEFAVHGAVAEDFGAWSRSRWRIVDAITILGPIVALLPQVSDLARGSLMFRVLRLGRAFAFGTRASSAAVRTQRGAGLTARTTTPTVTVIRAEDALQRVGSDWRTFLAWVEEPGRSWFHASNLGRDHFRQLAQVAGVPDQELDRWLTDDGHAKLREGARYATLVLEVPDSDSPVLPEVRRDRLLAVITDRGVLTATTGSFDLQASAMSLLGSLSGMSFPPRVASAVLSLVHERNASLAERFVAEVRRLEALDGGQALLREAFKLRREISTAALDVWHVRGLISALANGKTKLHGVDLKDEKYLDQLLADTESLHEKVDKTKEELKSLIELHINMKSFEMNRFLKLLAVVSFLGLIPSIAGGLLGMNVVGNPWSVTLGQVAFCVAMGMATALYVFAVRGWLK